MKKKKEIPQTHEEIVALAAPERFKYEIAEELGLLDKVKKVGWKGLSARETGKVGGLLAGKTRKMKEEAESK